MLKKYDIINGVNGKELFLEKEVDSEELILSHYNKSDVFFLMDHKFKIGHMANEYIYVLSYDKEDELLGFCTCGCGDEKSAELNVKKLLSFIFLTGGVKFSILHNHPEGILKPSKADKDCAMELGNIAMAIRTEFLGSYIITKDGYYDILGGTKEMFYE